MRNSKIMLTLFGVIVSICFAEAAMRIYYFKKFTASNLVISRNAKLAYEHKPSVEFVNRFGITVKQNSAGFIGNEMGPKKDDTYRILFIGDSVTEATYLHDKDRFANKTVALLGFRTGKSAEGINGGVGGYNTQQELELMKDKVLLVKPDLIVVGICLNDYVNTNPDLKMTYFNRLAVNIRDGSRARYLDFLYQRSDLYKFLYDTLYNLKARKYNKEGYDSYVRKYNFVINEEDFQRCKVSFLSMIELAKKNNAKILFVIFPLQNEVLNKNEYSYKPLSDFFKEENVYYMDLAKIFCFHSANGETLFINRDIIHPNSRGHDVTAEAISDYIIRNNILPR